MLARHMEATYQLFVEVWERRRESEHHWFAWGYWDWSYDLSYFESILDGAVIEREHQGYRLHEIDRRRAHAFLEGLDIADPRHTARTWIVVLAAIMMGYRYLYLQATLRRLRRHGPYR